MDAETLRPIVVGLLAGAITTAVMARSAGRRPPDAAHGGIVLRYGRGLKLFACASLLVWTAFTIRNAIHGSAVNSYLVAVSVPAVLTAGSAYLAIDALVTRVILCDDVIICRSPWRGTRVVAWSDVVDAWYWDLNAMWILRTRRQGKIRVGAWMVGADVVPAHLNRHHIPPRGEGR